MLNNRVKQFTDTYQLFEKDVIQQTQLQHRMTLVDSFEIKKGMHVLEIGCGQGDTTMILADAVGEQGHVTAIDIASGDYGAPMTLARAHDNIKDSVLGKSITFRLETDFLDYEIQKPVDVIVLSHCLWYFKSKVQLAQYFKKMHAISPRVCVAEWDLTFTNIAQRSHFCAVSILALYSTFTENDGNIQNVFSKDQIIKIAKRANYHLIKQDVVDASFLQDGAWEVDYANSIASSFKNTPESIHILVQTYYEVMNRIQERESLNSFVCIFEKR